MMDRRAWGIDEGYHDWRGGWHAAPDTTLHAIERAMGASDAPPAPVPMRFVRPHTHVPIDAVEVLLEDGTTVTVHDGVIPPDLPLGYHCLLSSSGATTALVVTPGACPMRESLRAWGWAVQLYAVRSAASWGLGDLADLRVLNAWARGAGAGLTVVNPLGAVLPTVPQQPSPYYPSSRRFANPLYLRVEDVPGASEIGGQLDAAAAAGRLLNEQRHIDRDEVFRLKRGALEAIWSGSRARRDAFERWWKRQPPALTTFATFCALADHHDGPWSAWPAEHRHPDLPAVRAFAAAHADRVAFHAWLQWLLDEQLAAAADELTIVGDLPVGVDPGGADAWEWQDLMALDMRVGAPPDEFNPAGQDWGLPPFDPWRLRAAGYAPFVETIRAALRVAGGLRIDHVMGLWRLFWTPPDGGPAAGTYVRYPVGELLDLLALESTRAGAIVVGEDLGTVEDGVREELAVRHILSTKLVWFEPVPPEQFPARALAAVSTHDLATIPGVWTGADLAAQRAMGARPDEDAVHRQRDRLRELTGVADDAPVADVVVGAYRRLGASPAMIVTASLDDALGVEERPNHPGTVDEWPNWRLALPTPLDAIESDSVVAAVGDALETGRAE